MKVENSRWREMDTSRARKRGRSLAQRLMDSGANLTVGGSGHVGLFFGGDGRPSPTNDCQEPLNIASAV